MGLGFPRHPVQASSQTWGGAELGIFFDRGRINLAELGFKQEPRDYVPHLTLGRTRSTSRLANSDVMERLAAEENTELGGMLVSSLQLIASFLDKSGPTYQIMDTIPLDS